MAEAKRNVVFAFDVESLGLYGTGFAVGAVVRDQETHEELDSLYAACPVEAACGDPSGTTPRDLVYVKHNVLPRLPAPTVNTPREVRDAFFRFYSKWRSNKDYDVTYVMDCGVPVEARFLADVARDDLPARCFFMPYPLHELGTVLRLHGMDPTAAMERAPGEEDVHNPLHDARQCARLWNKYT